MAGASKLTSLPAEHGLRVGSLLTFVPGLILLSVAGGLEDIPLLLITLVPLFFSVIASSAHLYLRRVQKRNHGLDDEPSSIVLAFRRFCGAWLWPASDLVYACTYLGLLIAFWVTQPNRNQWCGYYSCHYRDNSVNMLLAYSTVFPLLNMFIHFYFGIVGTAIWLKNLPAKHTGKCANCGHSQGPLIHRVAPVVYAHKADSATYSLLGDRNYGYLGEDLPRASMESGPSDPRHSDETAVDKV